MIEVRLVAQTLTSSASLGR